MKPRTKTLFAILFGIPLLMAASCAAVVYAVGHAGSLELSIHEKHGGGHVGVRLPALVVPMAMAVVHLPFTANCHSDCDLSMGVVANVLRDLADCPDGVLVDMRTSGEVVFVEKREGRLVVKIDTADETVSAAIPLSTARAVLSVI
ncbi:MAG TPA: hypothetical protein VFR10_05650 [bacterium]|nr:hypothetical protein [bacterium]